MPSILREFNISTVDILKVDIEGAEAQVFGPGCEEWLGRVRSLVVEVHDRMYPGCSAVVEGALKDFSGEVRLLLE